MIVIVNCSFSLLLILLLGNFAIVADSVQGKTLQSSKIPDSQHQYSYRKTQTSRANARILDSKSSCVNVRRPLNPAATPKPSETALDRYFRLAYNSEVAGDFDTAIINYRRAANSATCDCDRLYAQAGEQAAREAKSLLKTEGQAAKPTQFFWIRLQELTKSLSCVTVP